MLLFSIPLQELITAHRQHIDMMVELIKEQRLPEWPNLDWRSNLEIAGLKLLKVHTDEHMNGMHDGSIKAFCQICSVPYRPGGDGAPEQR